MKLDIWKILLFVVCLVLVFGFVDNSQIKRNFDESCIYYHPTIKDSSAVDCNEMVYGGTKYSQRFSGMLTNIQIKLEGTDEDLGVDVYIDPPELGESQVNDLLLVKSFTGLSCVTGYYDLVIPSTDVGSNVYGGNRKYGNVYIAVVDTNDTLTTDCKIWVLTE